MPIDKTVIDQIRREADFVTLARLLGHEVTRRAQRLFIVCPFHADGVQDGGSCQLNTHGSFNGRHGPNWFHCHGCKATGTIFRFYALRTGIDPHVDFRQSVVGVANAVGLGHLVTDFEGEEVAKAGEIEQFLDWLGLERRDPIEIEYEETRITLPRWEMAKQPGDVPVLLVHKPMDLDPTEMFSIGEEDHAASPPGSGPLALHRIVAEHRPTYPLSLILVPELDAVAVIDATGQTRGVLLPPDRAEAAARFSRGHAELTLTRGPELSGGTGAGIPLFAARVVVESPLEYTVLRLHGVPVTWGLWTPSTTPFPDRNPVEGPLRSTPAQVIPVLIALHLGRGCTGPKRMRGCLSPQQNWVPRELIVPDVPTLLHAKAETIESVAWRALHATTPMLFGDEHLQR